MEALIQEFFNVSVMVRVAPMILRGLFETLLLCAILVPIGLVGGLGTMLLATSPSRMARGFAVVFIDLFRSFPPLVLLIFVYSGSPFAGLRLSPLAAICVAFFLNASSYYGEIYRAGVLSVPRGGSLDGAHRGANLSLCHAAAGFAQRAAGAAFKHRRTGQAHDARQRHIGAGTAALGRSRALAHLQFFAAGSRRINLSCSALAARAAHSAHGT